MIDKKELFYWSPAVRWEIISGKLKIEKFNYGERFKVLFPEFYFYTEKGIVLEDLKEKFVEFDKRILESFINDLVKRRILVQNPLKVHELYYIQDRLYQNLYSEEIRYNAKALEKYKKEQLNREAVKEAISRIPLQPSNYPELIIERRTYRSFNEDKPVPFEVFSSILGVLKQVKDGEKIKYNYASAGGLYPVDVYVYVKRNRVETLKQGIYYYNPKHNEIALINDVSVIDDESHLFTNQSIFHTSAFSVFFFYNADVTMPKYSGMGYFYAGIDVGIMVATMTQIAELHSVGTCSIGDMNFEKIEEYFNLTQHQYHLHTVEFGLKP